MASCILMWNDREILLDAVKKNGFALAHASEDLKKDREIVLEAVKVNGGALQYASQDLKNDREIVLEAVKRYPFALRYASKDLQKDRNIIKIVQGMNCYAAKPAFRKRNPADSPYSASNKPLSVVAILPGYYNPTRNPRADSPDSASSDLLSVDSASSDPLPVASFLPGYHNHTWNPPADSPDSASNDPFSVAAVLPGYHTRNPPADSPDSVSNDPLSVAAVLPGNAARTAVVKEEKSAWEAMRVCKLQQIKDSWEESADPMESENQIARLRQISKEAAFAFNLEPDPVDKLCAVHLLIFAHYHEVALAYSPPDWAAGKRVAQFLLEQYCSASMMPELVNAAKVEQKVGLSRRPFFLGNLKNEKLLQDFVALNENVKGFAPESLNDQHPTFDEYLQKVVSSKKAGAGTDVAPPKFSSKPVPLDSKKRPTEICHPRE